MKIYRFEITSDTSKPIKILEPGAKKWYHGEYDAHLHLTFFEINIYTDIYKYIKKQNNGTLSIGENYDNNKRRNPFDHTSKKKPNVKS